MKFCQTDRTTTTIDLAWDMPRFPANLPQNIQGAVLVVATVERGTFGAGNPSPETLQDHQAAIEQLARQMQWPTPAGSHYHAVTTRGYVTRIRMVASGSPSSVAGAIPGCL